MHVLYVFNMHVKFHVNKILFSIQSMNLYFIDNFKLQKLKIKCLIDNIAIDFLFSRNFTSIENI